MPGFDCITISKSFLKIASVSRLQRKERGRAFSSLGFLTCDLSAHQNDACDCSDSCDKGKHDGYNDQRR